VSEFMNTAMQSVIHQSSQKISIKKKYPYVLILNYEIITLPQ